MTMNVLMLRHRALTCLFLPGRIGLDRGSTLMGVTLCVFSYMFVVRFPVIKMANKQMVCAAPDFAESDQVMRVKFKFGIEMERFDMVNL